MSKLRTGREPTDYANSPQSAMTIFLEVDPDELPKDSIFLMTSIPSTTLPNTTCLLSSHEVRAVQIKNCEPFVFLPEFAMDKMPGPVCFNVKFSSLNLPP